MSNLRLLVVDDALFMRRMIKNIFLATDIEVVGEAANGVEAVERFHQLQPDVVTMDIVMPHKSGLEAVRDICRMRPGACIVMCSALDQQSMIDTAMAAGASAYVGKPFSPEHLRQMVRQAWARHAASPSPSPSVES